MISTDIPEEILELQNQLPNKFEIIKDSLPKEPTDPDAKKEYYVGCYSADDWHFVHEILMQDGTLEDNIPDHSCECVNDCLHSATRGIYLLTDSEAEELRNSPKVEYVNINTGKYPGTHWQDPQNLIDVGENQFQRYSSSVSNIRNLVSAGTTTPTYPAWSRFYIIGITTNSTGTAYRTNGYGFHRGTAALPTTDNPSFELNSGDYLVFVNYEGTNDPMKIQTEVGIGGSVYTDHDLTYSSSSGNQFVRWYTETPGTYYYQSENTSTAVGTITVLARDTVDSSLKDRCGYQILRHKEQQDPWSSATVNNAINDSLTQRGDGTDVDVIVADTMAWFGHIEFQNNLGGPKGYKGGNVLPGNGTCDLLDLVLDSPYYIDPDFFDANPSKLTTRWDGTIVPTDSAAHDWWENNSTSHRSAKFVSPANGGTATGDNDFGTVSIYGLYLRQYAGTNTERNYGDEHGTSCASQVYGRQYGWAYNANKWYINLYGTFSGGIDVGFDIQKIFHKIKPINSKYGTRNPTVSSNSWGYRFNVSPWDASSDPKTGYYYYRQDGTGTGGVSYNLASVTGGGSPEFLSNFWQTGIRNEMQSGSMLTAGNELIDAGVIFVCSAGNTNQKLVKADHPDYNNYYSQYNNTALVDATIISSSGTYRTTVNNQGMPGQIGASGSGTNKVYKTICVGALDDAYNSSADSKESKVAYSNKGNLIDIYMAADGTVAAATPTFGDFGDYYRYIRPDQYYTIDGVQSRPSYDRYFNGTSSACPVFAGLLATKLQYQRDWTYAEVKEWISSLGEMDTNDFYYGTESTTVDDSNWSDLYSLEGAPAIVGWDKPTRDYDPLRITGNINFSTNLTPDFEIIDLAASVDEGQSISPTIGATSKWRNLLVDTRVYWDISGVSIASTDFSSVGIDGNPDTGTFLSGYVDVNGAAASKQFPIGVRSDNYTDDPSGANIGAGETATLSIYRDSSRTQLLDSSNFIINDTSTSSNFEFLLVGGGGGGGNTYGTNHQGSGGGGAGGVRVVSDSDVFDNNPTIWIGIGSGGGPGQNGNTTYLRDTNSTGTEIYEVGGGGRGGTDYSNGVSAPSGGGSGGGAGNGSNRSGGSGSTYGNDGGDTSSYCYAGGGGGAGGDGQTGRSSGADGGIGYDLTNFFSELAGDGHDGGNRIAGGGGAGRVEYYWDGAVTCSQSIAGTGRDGGGNGRWDTETGIHAFPNTGGGGGGGDGGPSPYRDIEGGAFYNVSKPGGVGGSGIVYLKYTSGTQLVGNWTGISTHHTATSYDQSVAGGTKRTWIHKITGDGALSLL